MSEHPFKVGDRVVSRKTGDRGIVRVVSETPTLAIKYWVQVEIPPYRALGLYEAQTWRLETESE